MYLIFHFFTFEISFFSKRIGGLRVEGVCFLLSFAFFSFFGGRGGVKLGEIENSFHYAIDVLIATRIHIMIINKLFPFKFFYFFIINSY